MGNATAAPANPPAYTLEDCRTRLARLFPGTANESPEEELRLWVRLFQAYPPAAVLAALDTTKMEDGGRYADLARVAKRAKALAVEPADAAARRIATVTAAAVKKLADDRADRDRVEREHAAAVTWCAGLPPEQRDHWRHLAITAIAMEARDAVAAKAYFETLSPLKSHALVGKMYAVAMDTARRSEAA